MSDQAVSVLGKFNTGDLRLAVMSRDEARELGPTQREHRNRVIRSLKTAFDGAGVVSDIGETVRAYLNADCELCSERLTGDAVVLTCGHRFHRDCFEEYSKSSTECPTCGQPILELMYPRQAMLVRIYDDPLYDVPEEYKRSGYEHPLAKILSNERRSRPILGRITFVIDDDYDVSDVFEEYVDAVRALGYFEPFTLTNPSRDGLVDYIRGTYPMFGDFDDIASMTLQSDGTVKLTV